MFNQLYKQRFLLLHLYFLTFDWLNLPKVCVTSQAAFCCFSHQECVVPFWGAAQLSVLVQPPAESFDQSETTSKASSSTQTRISSSVSVPGDGCGVERFGTTGHRTLHLPHHNPRSVYIHTKTEHTAKSCMTVWLLVCMSAGLKIEGLYRRCGIAPKVTRLVQTLMTSPSSAPLESDEQGVLDVCSALKQYVRQQESLIPGRDQQQWLHAAG